MSNNGNLIPPVLKPSALYTEEAKLDATRIRIYNRVLQNIYDKIKATARIPGNPKELWHVVPEFIPGVPRFHVGDAILYLAWNLRNAGYDVQYTPPTLLHVSWKAHDAIYREQESPWSQVLHAARGIAQQPAPSVMSPIQKPQPVEVVKRKTALKKTAEFTPAPGIVPTPSTPANVVNAMYTTPTPAPAKLPGQLNEKHVSFV